MDGAFVTWRPERSLAKPNLTVHPSTQYTQMLNSDGVSTHSCRTPVATRKYSKFAPPNRTSISKPE